MPRFVHTIRFRLSLTIALVVFAVGSLLIGGSYVYQANRIEKPVIESRPVVFRQPDGQQIETTLRAFQRDDFNRFVIELVVADTQRAALEEIRRSSYAALVLLFVSSFGAGWFLSGWALRPVGRITRVARDITATDLSRRIRMQGPEDELTVLAGTFDGMLDRLQLAFDDQRRFVHEASHELRNPLAVARTNLEVAAATDEPDDLRRANGIALRATERMSALVDDLLERAREGVPELNRSEVDTSGLLRDAAEEFAAAAGERSIDVVADVPDAPLTVHGDPAALRRAVSNLLANAVRLAPAGSRIVLVGREDAESVTLSVVDQGPGIAPADVERVFERFWRGDDPGTGSGLGLSIVRRIAERHGGTASVTSTPGAGSTFTLRLPRPIPHG